MKQMTLIFFGLAILIFSCNDETNEELPTPANEKFIGNWVGNASRHKQDINGTDYYDSLNNQIIKIQKGPSDDKILIYYGNSSSGALGIIAGNTFNYSFDNGISQGSGTINSSFTELHVSQYDNVYMPEIGVWDQYWFEYTLHK